MIDDTYILNLYNSGAKDEAFNLIVRKYSERLYWHIRELCGSHDDADDLLQTTLVKIWKGLDSFRSESKLYTWIWKIATNETLTFLKRKKLNALLSLTNYDTYIQNHLESEPYFNGDRLKMILNKAILSLPAKQRAVFSLRYFQEMKYEDMAKVLDTSVGALKASYHHAYTKVKQIVESEYDLE